MIIVEDKSIDKSLDIIKTFMNTEKIHILENSINKGVSYSRNRGLEFSSGKYILFIDGDDEIIYKNLLKDLHNGIYEFKSDYVFLTKNYYEKKIKPTSKLFDGANRVLGDYNKVHNKQSFIKKHSFPLGGSGSAVFNKRLSSKVFFDEQMKQFEDWDFFYRIFIKSKNPYFFKKISLKINFDKNSLSNSNIELSPPIKFSNFYYYLLNKNKKHSKQFFWINLISIIKTYKLSLWSFKKKGISGKLLLNNIILTKYMFYSFYLLIIKK